MSEITLHPSGGGEALALAWDRGIAESLAEGGAPSPWRIEGQPDWERAEAVRLVWAVFDDGRALALAALRPRGAAGHDHDSVDHYLAEGDDEVALTEGLLSTEYDAEGLVRRIGLELWIEPDSPPLRVAADRQGAVEVDEDGVRREIARMTFRLEGVEGGGAYEVLLPS